MKEWSRRRFLLDLLCCGGVLAATAGLAASGEPTSPRTPQTPVSATPRASDPPYRTAGAPVPNSPSPTATPTGHPQPQPPMPGRMAPRRH